MSDMRKYTLERDDCLPLEFTGTEIARANTDRKRASRFVEMIVYRTKGGKFVVHEIGHTRKPGERTFLSGDVYETQQELADALGTSRLASDLLAQLGVDKLSID